MAAVRIGVPTLGYSRMGRRLTYWPKPRHMPRIKPTDRWSGHLRHITDGPQEDRIEPGEGGQVIVGHHLPVCQIPVAPPVEPLCLHVEAEAPAPPLPTPPDPRHPRYDSNPIHPETPHSRYQRRRNTAAGLGSNPSMSRHAVRSWPFLVTGGNGLPTIWATIPVHRLPEEQVLGTASNTSRPPLTPPPPGCSKEGWASTRPPWPLWGRKIWKPYAPSGHGGGSPALGWWSGSSPGVRIVGTVKFWEPTALSRLVRLFVVAFAPLTLIMAIQTSNDWRAGELRSFVFWVTASLAAAGFIDAWRLPRGALKKGSVEAVFYDIQDQSGSVAAYVATYLLPFVGLQLSTVRDVLTLAVFFLVVLAIFLRSDLPAINPTLYITGWRVVRARVESSDRTDPVVVVLIPTGSHLPPRQSVPVVRFGDFLVQKKVVD